MKSRRKNEIMKRLVIEQALKMEEMAAMFGVSVETIRRDVADMERQGLVEKVYGGIRLRQNAGSSRSTLDSWGERMTRCYEEKARIAARALELMESGMSRKDAARQAAKELGLQKNLVYAATLK